MKYVQQAIAMDAYEVADNLTEADVLEWRCVSPALDPAESLYEAVQDSQRDPSRFHCYVLKDPFGDHVLLMGGWDVALGVAWFVTTQEAYRWPVRVVKALKECREEALKECPYLMNKVMKSSKLHVNLLDSLGAEWVGPITAIGGEPFQMFIIKEDQDV